MEPGEDAHSDEARLRGLYRGCLLVGAAGDALGAPVEFDSLQSIRSRFGEGGIRDFALSYGHRGAITDDTQMTLFTAEGLLHAHALGAEQGVCTYPTVLGESYLRWYCTQNPGAGNRMGVKHEGRLIGLSALHAQRAPGLTCLRALQRMPLDGIQARNDSKGCGGVMRVAPVGLYVAALEATKATKCVTRAFALGVDAAAITHGHPTGQLAAGAFAALIARLVQGATLDQALDETCAELVRHPNHRETLDAVNSARALADSASATPETLARLGQGWIAEEALAIGIFCALVATTLEEGIVLAVNHSGDSDSTGSIAGNLLGAMYGAEAIPQRWVECLELQDVIRDTADDLVSVRRGAAL